MPSYSFHMLSPIEFEDLVRDLLQSELGVRLESFKTGRDNGIDLRYSQDGSAGIIVQCKHYSRTPVSTLIRVLEREELPKVQKLKPQRYLIATSTELNPAEKQRLFRILNPFCQSTSDIFSLRDINALLAKYPAVERSHYKLWLTSTAVMERILRNDISNLSAHERQRIFNRSALYVQCQSFFEASRIIESGHYCVLAGIPGIGKTTLAEILALQHIQHGYELVKISSDISQAFSALNSAASRELWKFA